MQTGEAGTDAFTWEAPESFLGDRTALFGGTLMFSLRNAERTQPHPDDRVILVGSRGELYLRAQQGEATSPWATCGASLSVEAGWTLPDGSMAGIDILREVLAELRGIRIYTVSPSERGAVAIDEVVLSPRSDRTRPMTGYYGCE